MQVGSYRFDRVEFAGSLGDLGTLIPLSVGLILVTGLNLSSVFIIVGLFYVLTGMYYRLPIPVQPLKVVAAIAIAFPDKITVPIISATGLIFGITLLMLSWTGIIDWVAKFFTKPVVRGIQLGLGFILLTKGVGFIQNQNLFIQEGLRVTTLGGISFNTIIGIVLAIVALFFLSSRRFPAALIVVISGIAIGIAFGTLRGVPFAFGPTPIEFVWPGAVDYWNALIFLVIPQIPLTLGNAIIGTRDAAQSLFGEGKQTEKATHRGFATSMGLANIGAGFLCGMPVCHGAGGLAAHYRFGARTGGSNIMIGIIFLIIALVFGKVGIYILSAVPNAVLGVLLAFAGLELTLLMKDIKAREDLFIAFTIAGIALATSNMGIAFVVGIVIARLIKITQLKI